MWCNECGSLFSWSFSVTLLYSDICGVLRTVWWMKARTPTDSVRTLHFCVYLPHLFMCRVCVSFFYLFWCQFKIIGFYRFSITFIERYRRIWCDGIAKKDLTQTMRTTHSIYIEKNEIHTHTHTHNFGRYFLRVFELKYIQLLIMIWPLLYSVKMKRWWYFRSFVAYTIQGYNL